MLVAEVNTVNPWVVNAVAFCILALVFAQALVVVQEAHEAVLVVLRNETECAAFHFSIGRNINSVVVVTVAVHVVNSHVRIVVATTPGFVDE